MTKRMSPGKLAVLGVLFGVLSAGCRQRDETSVNISVGMFGPGVRLKAYPIGQPAHLSVITTPPGALVYIASGAEHDVEKLVGAAAKAQGASMPVHIGEKDKPATEQPPAWQLLGTTPIENLSVDVVYRVAGKVKTGAFSSVPIDAVVPGSYALKVEKPDCAPLIIKKLALSEGQVLKLDLPLQPSPAATASPAVAPAPVDKE